MRGVNFFRPLFVDTFPPVMDSGVLYVSIPYSTCGHLCACGCGEEVVTPLSPAQWALTFDGETVSLMPSMGNWGLPCRSHYWITKGTVRWSRRYTAREIDDNRKRDRKVLQQHLGESPHGRLDRLYRRVRGQGS